MKKFQLTIKRFFDFFASLIGIVLLSPIYIVTIICLKIFMPGPVFFKQKRAGKNGEEFEILKFRTMKVDKKAEATFDTTKDADRLTAFGKVLRRTKIDETPQLFNVLKGDMSLVGPRPTLKNQVDNYTDFQKQRLDMRPGMTGLAQVNGNIFLDWEERIVYDVEYVHNYSILLDIKILFKTVLIVVFGEEKFVNSVEITDEEKLVANIK